MTPRPVAAILIALAAGLGIGIVVGTWRGTRISRPGSEPGSGSARRAEELPLMICPTACTGTYSREGLRFTGLRESYETFAGIRAKIENASGVTLYADPIAADFPPIARYLDGHDLWECLATWRCANAGAGTPRSLDPGKAWEIRLQPGQVEIAGVGDAAKVRTDARAERPLAGTYRLVVAYAEENWPVWDPPSQTYCAVSPPFEIRPRPDWVDRGVLEELLRSEPRGGGHRVVSPTAYLRWSDPPDPNRDRLRLIGVAEKIEGIGTDAEPLVDSMLDRSWSAPPLRLNADPNGRYVIDGAGEFEKYFLEGGGGWERWHGDHPQASEFVRVSLPGYVGDRALVYFERRASFGDGEGELVLLEPRDGIYRIVGSSLAWIN